MQVFLLNMCILFVLWPALMAAGAQTLSIDSQLGTSVEDCFERISIGEQLPANAIYRNVSELTTRECEQICKQDKQCQAYDYGVGAKGNATCNLSNLNEKELKEKNTLFRHPDYDVYVRRFQCEQAPPLPLKPLSDEDSAHRPIFRPEVDDSKQPLADDFDSRPFETTRPGLRPYPAYRPYRPSHLNHNERPDDYNRPAPLDRPPSYGLHRPQDIPYRPERPYHNHSFDPYDVLQFQGERPQYPVDWRPDPAYPARPSDDIPDLYGQNKPRPPPPLPPYRPDDPQYLYITRPNRKPTRPSNDVGYGYDRPQKPVYPTLDSYGPNNNRPLKPNRPVDYNYRPNERPHYDYNSQYASNYGQNQYSDNSVYVEIYDPPRPYKPIRPMNDRPYDTYGPNYGYGQNNQGTSGGYYTSQNLHAQNSQSYGSGLTELDNYNRPLDTYEPQRPGYSDSYVPDKPYNPIKPVYGVPNEDQPSPSYGDPAPVKRPERPQNNPQPGYEATDADQINYKPTKPAYSSETSGYGSSETPSHFGSYGGSSYGSQKPQDNYPKPTYPLTEKPSYVPTYNNKPIYNHGSYDNHGLNGNNQNYNSHQGYGTQSYGNGHRPIQSIFQQHNQQSSYGGSSQYYGYQESYNRPSDHRPIDRPSYGGGYGNTQTNEFYVNRPNYDKPAYHRPNEANFNQRPPYNKPYEPEYDKPSYNRPSHNKPSYDKPYDDKPLYDNLPNNYKPLQGNPAYDKPIDSNRPGSNIYNDKPNDSYDNDRPDGSYGSDNDDGYKTNGKPKPNQTDNYNKPSVKPVYEYEVEKPNNVPSYVVRPSGEVVTSRPVTIGDYGRPGYGREPPVSYKACFRRVLAGKRTLRSFVRRVVGCERLEDCRRECAEERRFHCESFNYRQDPSIRGKGVCEMLTKPIEEFDLRRDFVEDKDYDFYELDRNSLEPYCPETLRGPGMLHSGFLSSKPDRESYQQNSWDRNDWYDRGQDRNRYYDRNRNPGRKRYEDQFFVPYQIGLARTYDDQENWGQYGGYYGNPYYKGRNDYHKSITHWGLNDLEPPLYGVRPLVNREFNYNDLVKKIDRYGYGGWKRGRWNSSGSTSGLDSSESNYYRPPRPVVIIEEDSLERSDEIVIKDCSSRRKPGMSLGSGAIRRSLFARTVVQCESACFNERNFKCVSYSYRYSNSFGSDNCFLSERPYRGLELSTDSGSDVYAMPEDSGCPVTTKPFIESECFWHVRSGASVSGSAGRAALTVAGLGACEAECIRAHDFFCRGFSFRFDAPTIGDDLENCILTSTPPTSLDTGRGLRPTAGHELYARGNYGRGCEPALYDDLHQGETGECYLQYDNAAKLIGSAVKGHAKVADERSCGRACTDAPFRCLSFSFNNNSPPDSDNCLLSEIRLFDLQRGVDYEHSTDDWLFAFDLFNSKCWRKVHGHDSPSPEVPRPISGPEYPPGPPSQTGSGPDGPTGYLPAPPGPSEPYLPLDPPSGSFKPSYPAPGYIPAEPPGFQKAPGPDYSAPSGPYRPSGPTGPRPSGPYLPTAPETAPGYGPPPFRPPSRPHRPIGPPGPSGLDTPEYIGTGYGPPGPVGPPGYPETLRPDREEPVVVSWRHYTVSGFPCKKGSSCAQNHVAGHWACEPEGGEIGSWDYCCAPTHRCGYSEGFHKPWCYVGPSKDQWRPCSEKYYPYHQHNIPHPSQGHGHGHGHGPGGPPSRPPRPYDGPDLPYLPEADRRYWEQLYNNGPQAYYDKYGNPFPGYTRVPMSERPYIKYHHNYPRPGSGQWVPVPAMQELDPPVPGGLGVPRYWPVAYLHKGPPPNTTYLKYNHTESNNDKRKRPIDPHRDHHRDNDFRDTGRNRNDFRDTVRDQNDFRDTVRDQNYFRDNERYDNTFRDSDRNNFRSSSRDDTPIDSLPTLPYPRNDDTKDSVPQREPTLRDSIPRNGPRDRNVPRERPTYAKVNPDRPSNNNLDNTNHRDEKTRNITAIEEDVLKSEEKTTSTTTTTTSTTTPKVETVEETVNSTNITDTEVVKTDETKSDEKLENFKGIDDKIVDFSHSIEVLDIEDAKKGEKISDLKTLEAEEKQIEAIGRLLAARRGTKLVLEKRSQKDLESKSIALDKDLVDFNFGNRFATNDRKERKGTVQRITKDELERERNIDKSLEVSETTFVRPPRVLSTTENIRKAIVNGKVFYSATVREQRDSANSTRRPKSLRPLEDKAPSVLGNINYGKKKIVRTRNVTPVNPVRKVRRVYRRKYNPDEVRRRLLERERSMRENAGKNDTKVR